MVKESKRVMLLFVLLVIEMLVFSNLIFTDWGNAARFRFKTPPIAVSEARYVPPKEEDDAAKKVVSRDDIELEEVVAEESSVQEIIVAEPEMDWQPYQASFTGESDINDEVYYEDISSDDTLADVDNGVVNANVDEAWISGSEFVYSGVHNDSSGYSYTYYSQNVLPGGGLDIPGRHVNEEGYVVDGDGNLCLASNDLPYGTVVNVPFGTGTAVVYDCGSGPGILDVYVAW